MGRAIDLFVTYRFLKLLTTPFEKTEAFKLGIIDEKGNRVKLPKSTRPAVELATVEQKNAYTILHKLVFNIKKILFSLIKYHACAILILSARREDRPLCFNRFNTILLETYSGFTRILFWRLVRLESAL